MTKETQLQNIQKLIPILVTFNKSGQAKITPDQQQLLKETYQAIYQLPAQISCSTCVIEYLNQLLSYYEKHAPSLDVPEPQSKSKKPCTSCKKKSF